MIERLGRLRTLSVIAAILAVSAIIAVLTFVGLNAAFALLSLLATIAVLGLAKLQVDVSVRLRRIDQRILKLRADNSDVKKEIKAIHGRIVPVQSAILRIRSELDSHFHSQFGSLELERSLSGILEEVNGIRSHLGDLHNPGSDYRQLEALFGLYQLVNFRQRVPPMRGWSASPDFLLEVVSKILAQRPKTVLECGSGVSTLVMAYALHHVGMGHLYSLEHREVFAQQTTELLKLHGLSDWVSLLNAPLKEVELRGDRWMWYEPEVLEAIDTVSFAVVDGPPGATQPLVRYPLVPMIYQKLESNAVVVLDDYKRIDERAVVERWTTEFEGFVCKELDHEKGTAVLVYSG